MPWLDDQPMTKKQDKFVKNIDKVFKKNIGELMCVTDFARELLPRKFWRHASTLWRLKIAIGILERHYRKHPEKHLMIDQRPIHFHIYYKMVKI